jgi:ribosomal protein S18 acetylase RimI-like enzyme
MARWLLQLFKPVAPRQYSKMTKLTVVPATSDTFAVAARMRADMALEMGNDWDSDHPGWHTRFIEFFTEKQRSRHGEAFLAYCHDEYVGMTIASLTEDYHSYALGRTSGRINSVYVKPQFRRRGIARELMLTATGWLRDAGCVVVRLNSSEEGVHLYSSLGFKPRREFELQL